MVVGYPHINAGVLRVGAGGTSLLRPQRFRSMASQSWEMAPLVTIPQIERRRVHPRHGRVLYPVLNAVHQPVPSSPHASSTSVRLG